MACPYITSHCICYTRSGRVRLSDSAGILPWSVLYRHHFRVNFTVMLPCRFKTSTSQYFVIVFSSVRNILHSIHYSGTFLSDQRRAGTEALWRRGPYAGPRPFIRFCFTLIDCPIINFISRLNPYDKQPCQ